MATERYETEGINKVLDFEDTGENAPLSTVDESEGPSMSRGRGSQSQGISKDVGTQSNPAINPDSEEHSGEEEAEETSLMEPEGGFETLRWIHVFGFWRKIERRCLCGLVWRRSIYQVLWSCLIRNNLNDIWQCLQRQAPLYFMLGFDVGI